MGLTCRRRIFPGARRARCAAAVKRKTIFEEMEEELQAERVERSGTQESGQPHGQGSNRSGDEEDEAYEPQVTAGSAERNGDTPYFTNA